MVVYSGPASYCLAAVLLLSLARVGVAGGDSATSQGKSIYKHGSTSAGIALIGAAKNSAPATLFPCSNCHGDRAQGKQETGIVAPAIDWRQLSTSYRSDATGGKARNPYNFDLFKSAVTEGIDADGNELSFTMPRYPLDDSELQALIQYLSVVTRQSTAGVDENTITIRLSLPGDSNLARVVRQTASAYIAHINQQGGIYRRRLQLQEEAGSQPTQGSFCHLDLSLQQEQVATDNEITLGIFSTDNKPDNTYTLYTHPSRYTELAHTIVVKKGWIPIKTANKAVDQLLDEITSATANSIALIHGSDGPALSDLIKALNKQRQPPVIVLATALPGSEEYHLVADYSGEVYALGPPGLNTVTPRGKADLLRLANSTEFSGEFGQHISVRLWTLSVLKLLVSTLQKSGHDLTPTAFINAIQSHVDLKTEFGPPLSFSSARHEGYAGPMLYRVN